MIIWVLIGYMFLYIHRPFEVWPVLASVRLELLYMIVTTMVWLASPKVLNLNRLTFAILLFAASMLFSWIVSDYAAEGQITVTNWLKLLPFYLMMITSVKDERDLKRVMTAFLVVFFIYMSHSLREFLNGRHVYRMGIARMIGVDVAQSDPNSFAASIIYVLPMWIPFWRMRENRKQTAALVLYMGMSVLCVLLTGSRSGLIALSTFALMCILLSKRRVAMLFLVFVAAGVGWFSLPEDLQNRYLTIVDDSAGPENAQTSKDSRYFLLIKAIEIWQDEPIFGYGPGGFLYASGTGFQPHSLYGQVLSELGIVGVIALVAIIACIVLNFWEAHDLRKMLPPDERTKNFEYQITRSVFMSLILLLLLGGGGHNLYRYTWIWYAAFQGIALTFLRRQADEFERQSAREWNDAPRPMPSMNRGYRPQTSQ